VSADYGDRSIDTERQWRSVKGTAVAGKDGEYEYDLGGAFPVDRAMIDLPQVNSIVPVQIFIRSSAREEWRPAATTVSYRLAQDGGEVASPSVKLVGDARQWLLRTDPRAGAIGEVPVLRVGWQPSTLVFAVRGASPFMLAYGRHAAKPGALPVATLIPGYDPSRDLPANVAVAQVASRTELGGASRLEKPLDTKRWLLWASLALAAALLGWMAYRLSKQIGVIPDAAMKQADSSSTNADRT
jgi:hypothetical protein